MGIHSEKSEPKKFILARKTCFNLLTESVESSSVSSVSWLKSDSEVMHLNDADLLKSIWNVVEDSERTAEHFRRQLIIMDR